MQQHTTCEPRWWALPFSTASRCCWLHSLALVLGNDHEFAVTLQRARYISPSRPFSALLWTLQRRGGLSGKATCLLNFDSSFLKSWSTQRFFITSSADRSRDMGEGEPTAQMLCCRSFIPCIDQLLWTIIFWDITSTSVTTSISKTSELILRIQPMLRKDFAELLFGQW